MLSIVCVCVLVLFVIVYGGMPIHTCSKLIEAGIHSYTHSYIHKYAHAYIQLCCALIEHACDGVFVCRAPSGSNWHLLLKQSASLACICPSWHRELAQGAGSSAPWQRRWRARDWQRLCSGMRMYRSLMM